MFKIKTEKFQVVVLDYAEDLVVLGFTEVGVKWVKDKLRFLFKVMNLQEISYFLGVTFERTGNVISLHHIAYCRRVLKCFGLGKGKSTPTQMVHYIANLFEGAVTSEAGQTAL